MNIVIDKVLFSLWIFSLIPFAAWRFAYDTKQDGWWVTLSVCYMYGLLLATCGWFVYRIWT